MVPALDWLQYYRPAALSVWHGGSPYDATIYFAAPWSTYPLIPFALLPVTIGRWSLFIVTMIAYALIAYKLGAKPVTLAFLLLSYPVLADVTNGNIEWMPMLGFILPPQIGLIFAWIKPQVGIGITIFWFVQAWRTGGVRQVIKIFAPVTTVLLISFILYGFWPLRFLDTLTMAKEIKAATAIDYNMSLWPWGLLLGVPLLIKSIKDHEKRLSIMSGPFLSPYALITTYGTALLAWVDKPLFFFIAWLLTWLPFGWKLLTK